MVINKEITLGTFVAFSNYIMVLAGPLMELGWFLNGFRKGFVTIDRLLEIERETPQVIEVEKPEEPDLNKTGGEAIISFSNMAFSYGENFGLSDITIDIRRGEKIAFIGTFGSGKSSLLKMIMRFSDPDSGSIKIAGTELRNLRLKSVRDRIGYVPQDCYLFSDTILENIAFGREYTPEELDRALATAQLKDTISTFRRGLDEEIGIRGLSLSGGQKQRVSIARSLLKSPDIILLDDATSSLDNKTEDTFWTEVAKSYAGATIIFTSHRLNTIKHADRVFILEAGKIADSGSFDDLLENSAIFKKLIQTEKKNDQKE